MTSGIMYNLKSPGVKRLMREAAELREATEEYYAKPLEDNLFEWHFTVRGPPGTEFEGGLYHGRILLPTQYPMQPPNIILLTPNGRFEINKKICLSISGYHPESWQPSWSIRTALLALIAFMPSPGRGTIGSLDYTAEERQALASKSQLWECKLCGKISDHLIKNEGGYRLGSAKPLTQEETELIQQIALKAEDEKFDKKENSLSNHTESNPSVENQENVLRQRTATTTTIITSTEQLQRSNIVTSDNLQDRALTLFMFLLIGAIFLLIFRRLFFL